MLNSSPRSTGSTRPPVQLHASLAHGLWVVAALSSFALLPRAAHAQTTIAGDLDWDVPISNNEFKTSGGGFGIRLGQQLHLPLLALNPEIGFTYASFAKEGPTMYRGIAGLRLGFGEVLRFGVMGHIGYGYANYHFPNGTPDRLDPTHGGFTFDAGAFLDFTLLPLLNIGLHFAYNRIAAKDPFDVPQWLQMGAHAALVF